MCEKIIAACGNDCAVCPRYNVPPYTKTAEELRVHGVDRHGIPLGKICALPCGEVQKERRRQQKQQPKAL